MPRVCSPRFLLPFRFRRQRNCMSNPSPALRFTISISICLMPAAFISKSLDAICCLCGIRLKCSPNQCNLTVDHYYLENQSPLYTIHLLNTFWNFFHKPWFFPYSVTTVSPTFLPSTSLLSMDIDFKDGKKKSYLLLPKESDKSDCHSNAIRSSKHFIAPVLRKSGYPPHENLRP